MFKIITQTDDFIIVSKNADINFHDEGEPGLGFYSQVKNFVFLHCNITEIYPVHRLDKMTSGLLLFATNKKSAAIFGKLFQTHQVEKYYLAISNKKPTKKQGLIKGDMAKSRRGMFKLMRTMDKPAITQFLSYSLANKLRLYLLKPHSGKTHQLRVALSSIGAPIYGDPLYNLSSSKRSQIDRGYLHAYALRFTFLNNRYEFVLPPIEGEIFGLDSFKKQLLVLKKPWLLSWPKI